MSAKIDFLSQCSTLLPKGIPDYLSVVKYPKLEMLIFDKGRKEVHVIVTLLVKDFCASLNVVRNMTEEQMIDAANMLVDECDNFRLEDYVIMFQMAKKGELVKIYDRIDLQLITDILDAYWVKRHEAGEKEIVEEVNHFDSLGSSIKLAENIHPKDREMLSLAEGIGTYFSGLKDFVESEIGDKKERERLKQIEIEDSQKIREQLKQRGYE